MQELSKQDIDHLEWMYRRMIGTHNENENVDYMIRFREIIEKLKPNKDPWTCRDCGNSVYNCKCQ